MELLPALRKNLRYGWRALRLPAMQADAGGALMAGYNRILVFSRNGLLHRSGFFVRGWANGRPPIFRWEMPVRFRVPRFGRGSGYGIMAVAAVSGIAAGH